MDTTNAPKCRNCGVKEWRHICGGLIGKAGEVVKAKVVQKVVPRETPKVLEVLRKAPGARKQRWDRKDYNRYQRVLMALRETAKAVGAGRACAWPKELKSPTETM